MKYFSYFSQKISFDRDYFHEMSKLLKNIMNLSFAEFAQIVIKVSWILIASTAGPPGFNVTGPPMSNKYDILDGFDDQMFENQTDSSESDE